MATMGLYVGAGVLYKLFSSPAVEKVADATPTPAPTRRNSFAGLLMMTWIGDGDGDGDGSVK